MRIGWEPDELSITVTNPALEAAPAVSGYGLSGMDERVRRLGGHVAHQSTQGRFELTLVVPLLSNAGSPAPGATQSVS